MGEEEELKKYHQFFMISARKLTHHKLEIKGQIYLVKTSFNGEA